MFKWIGIDGVWKIGTVASLVANCTVDDRLTLMRHYHTGELEWIETSKLSPYVVPEEYKQPS